MRRAMTFTVGGGVVLLALAGCGRSFLMDSQRAPWRHEAEVACMKSGAVKFGVEQIEPIEGPGACGMDFPLKVTELGEYSPALSYAGDLRPPAAIPNGSAADMPNWPPSGQRYSPNYRPQPAPVQSAPPATVPGERLHWVTGPPGVDLSKERPAGQPMSISPPQSPPVTTYSPRAVPAQPAYPAARARARPSDIPDDAVIPKGGSAGVPEGALGPESPRRRMQPAYNAPVYRPPPQHALPRLGPTRRPQNATLIPAEIKPAAKLACPMVSALDRWVSEGVQPAAVHWFGQPVTEIHQIGSYACRHMVGGEGVSEHSFGNALDISGFTLADGRTITVKNGWKGTPEEQGFLHDVQLYACQTFVTVLAPGYNIYHYNHIHVDLMKRRPGYRPCRPDAIPGEVVAARARKHYAATHHRAPAYTGSIGALDTAASVAEPEQDGFVPDDGKETSAPLKTPAYLGHPVKLPNEDRFKLL